MRQSVYSDYELRSRGFQIARLTIDGKKAGMMPGPLIGVVTNGLSILTMELDAYNELFNSTDAIRRAEWFSAPCMSAGVSVVWWFQGIGELAETEVAPGVTVSSSYPVAPGFGLETFEIAPPGREREWLTFCRRDATPQLPSEIRTALAALKTETAS